jgi:hypothetical protein
VITQCLHVVQSTAGATPLAPRLDRHQAGSPDGGRFTGAGGHSRAGAPAEAMCSAGSSAWEHHRTLRRREQLDSEPPTSDWSTMVNTTNSGSKVAIFADWKAAFGIAGRIGLGVELVPYVMSTANRTPAKWLATASLGDAVTGRPPSGFLPVQASLSAWLRPFPRGPAFRPAHGRGRHGRSSAGSPVLARPDPPGSPRLTRRVPETLPLGGLAERTWPMRAVGSAKAAELGPQSATGDPLRG